MTSAGDFHIQIKRNIRAKRMNLRYDPTTDCAVITLPRFNNENDAIVFVNKNLEWLQKQRVSSPDIIYLAPEQIIPLYGEDHLIKHRPDKTGRVIISSNEIIVGGHVAGFSVRLENYLKKQIYFRDKYSLFLVYGFIGRGVVDESSNISWWVGDKNF